jgi:hypothetical protein
MTGVNRFLRAYADGVPKLPRSTRPPPPAIRTEPLADPVRATWLIGHHSGAPSTSQQQYAGHVRPEPLARDSQAEAALRLHHAGPGGGGGPAALPRPIQRPFGRYDKIASVVSYTSICRSHDVTELSAPTADFCATSSPACDEARHPREGAGPPRPDRRPRPTTTHASTPGAAGHAGHDPALAPTAGRPPPDDRTYPTQSISHSPDARRSALPRAPGTRLRGTIGAATVLEEEIWLRAR